jgi:predicted PurR-regulated permease PerM
MASPRADGTSIEKRKAPPRRRHPGPTPIPISKAVRNLIVLAIIAVLVLIVWAVPIVVVVLMGGFAVALVLSFPVHLFSRILPRGLAILLAFLILLAILLLAFYVLVPVLLKQMGALARALPGLIDNLERYLIGALEALNRRGLLPSTPEEIADGLGQDLTASLGVITGNILGGTLGVVYGTFSFAVTLFAVIFIAASLLANVRKFKAAYLTSVPSHYRRDARELWDALAHTLSRYLGGLAFVLILQGVLSGGALYLIGLPYPLALGAWVSITAVIPYLGAWLGAVPAVLVAFSISPKAVALTAVVFLAIQQLEGNFLTPRIQGQAIKVPSVIVFLGVIVGGALAGLTGVLFAVPTVAVIRVLFDFFRVRLRMKSRDCE